MDEPNKPIDPLEESSLETPETPTNDTGVVEAPTDNNGVIQATDAPSPKAPKGPSFFKRLSRKINIYFLLLLVMILMMAGFIFYAIKHNSTGANNTVSTQELTKEDLAKLKNTDASVGDPKQTLSIESNAVFAGKVLVRDNLDVAGSVKIGGTLSLAGVNIGGTSALDQIQGRTLTITGDSTLQGRVTVQNSLTVTGNVTVSGLLSAGTLAVETLTLNKDLVLNKHINSEGSTPGRANGSALGSGGTSSVAGSDTAGTATINTGSSAPAGCFMSITFTAAYGSTPRVLLTAASSAAGGVDFYTTRSTTGFSICSASDPPDASSLICYNFVSEKTKRLSIRIR